MSDKTSVKIYVYDLSKGMMAAMSQQFLGKHIAGLWHTGVVAYGQEYFFGGGIQMAPAGCTPAGNPDKVVDVGETEVPQWLFDQFLEGLRDKYTAETYHLMKNNCNNFADEAAQFLTGTGVPDYVTGLPDEFASTPMGAMLAPMIEQFFGQMQGNGAPIGASNNTTSLFQGSGRALGSNPNNNDNMPLD
eukprot:m.58684 g.58684  ORF g.58684 m.58684 type:complete len:189 (+) comp22597_c0_seq1:214-780(+)